eukprot:Plantae.Rhodophyta-Hildenbrandia_rubra.ctg3868.p1 GENE.Plantae.Rhodophyta-Hildenbrandia_rubra.ctg3868~~Plantae.Rhodophyta-Hildenbrandia_rubra.ctg3868.p1  ORF type:complete len:403 (+),score=57.00 Plantae.Rhodophyta-Hildenbrandia_rubra.ctg3868:494-1702(+)
MPPPTAAPFIGTDSPFTSSGSLESGGSYRASGNFSAGPSCLASTVMYKAASEFTSYNGTGMGIMEMSHRDTGGPVQNAIADATNMLRELLDVPRNYHILFMQGGAHGQFAAVPLNLCGPKKKACFVSTGFWSERAAQEAEKYCEVVYAHKGCLEDYSRIPPVSEWKIDNEAAYVHICANETIHGLEYHEDPVLPESSPVLVGDFTSTLLSRPVDISKYGVIYASAGKNLGPAGVTTVIVRDDLIGAFEAPQCPSVLSYSKMAASKPIPSIYNTPPTFLIYMMSLVLRDNLAMGGLKVLKERAVRRTDKLYDLMENSNGFYELKCKDIKHRSVMNIPFRIRDGDFDLEQKFADIANSKGLFQLKCHPKFPGLRVTLYNGIPDEGVNRLVDHMMEFMTIYASHP